MAKPRPVCSVEDCERPVLTLASGWCSPHYQRARVHDGDPLAGRTPLGEPYEFLQTALASTTDECIIWPFKSTAPEKGGYGQIWIDGTHKSVHVLACEAANGPRPPGTDAAHGPCHTPLCLNRRHLSWKTRKENMADQERDGTRNRGERNGGAKVTEADVLAIRAAGDAGESPQSIAPRYGLSVTHVGSIIRRQKWRHVM